MTGLLKFDPSSDTRAAGRLPVRSLFGVLPASRPAPARPAGAVREEDPALAALKARVGDLTREVLRLQTELETAADAAFEDGRQAAAAAFERDEEAARAQLGRSLEAAQAAFERELEDAHRLAIALAQTAVAKILGDSPGMSSVVESILRNQLAKLRPETVVAVTVSPLDFKDEGALTRLAKSLGTPELVLQRDAQMQAGDCRILLKVGHMDAGLAAQWGNLVAFCDALANAPETPR